MTINVEGANAFGTSLIGKSSYTNAGTINLIGPGTALRTENGDAGDTETLTNASTGTIAIPATGAAGLRTIAGDVNNQGTITVSHPDATFQQAGESRNPKLTNAGTLTIGSGGAMRFLESALVQSTGGTINGPGSINVAGGAFAAGNARRLEIAGGTIAASADVNLAGGDAALQFTGGTPSGNIDVTAGTHALSGNVPSGISIDIDGAAALQSATSFTNSGTISLNAGNAELRTENANAVDAEKLTNNGTITVPAGGSAGFRFIAGDLENAGTISIANPEATMQTRADGRDPKLTNVAAGTVTVASGSVLRLLGQQFSNAGSVQVAGQFNVTTGYEQTAGTTTLVAPGSISAGTGQAVSLLGGTLRGNGTVGPNLSNSGGTVQPGASPGTLNVTGNYTQGAGGTLRSEVQGTTAGTTYDRLAVGGSATLAGTLVVDSTGFTPADADTFDIVTFASRTGTFTTTTGLASAGGGKTYNVVYNPTNVRLTVNPAPPDDDGDGIANASDACPNQSDLAAPRNPRTGCPADPPPPADSDGDGIPNASDACPNQSDAGAPRSPRTGCPAAAPPVVTPLTAKLGAIPGNRLKRSALVRGVKLSVTCSLDSRATAKLSVSRAVAKKLKLALRAGQTSVTIGSGVSACAAATGGKLKLKPKSALARKVRARRKSVAATLVVVVTRTGSQPVTIRRSLRLT